ncbi:hypothetical protein [Lactobacillus hominis]|uniref:DUF2642 domain-containing protein n=1 Tax=Lactobacillus hominis DSM 23910 = CRBIP 24.179 TaxID=1423758 RepID=I7IVS0_9LACO|nr:hypothetical protein [Lactobacillus hominis]KRM85555.1 hypothetical protein FC41_GL000865 [Lactobacillus hominis DSM 23910 = CRBIP 24.179]MCT3347384.1 hypothetical protein [Lactobacillus hominis]CCI81928.1 Putative uncharacterized protein [Lactobacillus hominis DSM 23910 = CRBIP 24.179]
MKLAKSIQAKINSYAKHAYHHFFDYNLDALTTYAQSPAKIIRILEHALFYREFVLITYQNGTTEIGQLVGRTSSGRFILRSHDHKMYHIIDLGDLFNIEVD